MAYMYISLLMKKVWTFITSQDEMPVLFYSRQKLETSLDSKQFKSVIIIGVCILDVKHDIIYMCDVMCYIVSIRPIILSSYLI